MTSIPPYALPPVVSPEFLILAFLRSGNADGHAKDWIPLLRERFHAWALSITEAQFKEAVTRLGEARLLDRDAHTNVPEHGGPPDRDEPYHFITQEGEQVLAKHLEILRAVLSTMGDD